MRRAIANGATVVVTVLVAIFIYSATSAYTQSTPVAERVEQSETCLDCHEDLDLTLLASVHAVAQEAGSEGAMHVTCVDCHSGWEGHVEEPEAGNIENPGRLGTADQALVCSRCHVTPHQAAMATSDPHPQSGVACADCHKIHDNNSYRLVKDERENYCRACHSNVMAEFKRRSSHPLETDNIRCVDCHSLGEAHDPMGATGLDWRCQQCHAEVSGPFRFEHEAVNKHSVDGGGCTECHNPHGSPNDRLLIQPGNRLCNQCHGVPPGHRTTHGGIGVRYDCVDCHSEIHGSQERELLLDPLLGSKLFPDCYQSGCHTTGN